GYGSLVRGGRGSQFTFHHNLWASHLARMPRPGNYDYAKIDPIGAFMDFRNSVFYNWGGDASGYNADDGQLATYNFVGNAYIPGPDTKGRAAFKEGNAAAKSWFADNAMDGVVPADPWSLVIGKMTVAQRLSGPAPLPPVATESWDKAYARVMAAAGASLTRDSVDQRILDGVKSRTHHIINSQDEVGGWPVLKSAPAPLDSDGDGMPDAWEASHGLNPKDAKDGARVGSGGYTNLEVYLNSLVPPA
ncbi:MAG TPA: thrombospondin type 3 repeat-containing protein, partial [Hyphomonadaceae bacterium]|nr:thrombospondin type 3 repeat-containing protein [Hyphomonadaceae bacterium]